MIPGTVLFGRYYTILMYSYWHPNATYDIESATYSAESAQYQTKTYHNLSSIWYYTLLLLLCCGGRCGIAETRSSSNRSSISGLLTLNTTLACLPKTNSSTSWGTAIMRVLY